VSDDAIPTDLNPGIVRTVAALVDAGFHTSDSGDGETHDYDCDREYGYVVCIVPDPVDAVSESHRLATVLTGLGLVVVPRSLVPPPDGQVTVEASYSPSDGIAIIDVSYVHDRMLTELVRVVRGEEP
jgi:hypothetical protein